MHKRMQLISNFFTRKIWVFNAMTCLLGQLDEKINNIKISKI
jgi:hypothetical protein